MRKAKNGDREMVEITGQEVEIILTKAFHRATIRHPLTGKTYELLKTQRFHDKESIHGLTLRAQNKT